MTAQTDFGGFDPAFFGVSVHFTSVHALELLQEFRASPTPLPVAHLPPLERFEALSLFSVLDHEVRHFHDSLLAPYGAFVFLKRIEMLVNLLEVLPYVLDERLNPGANCLPVPLARWWRWDNAARERWLSQLPPREDGKPWTPVNVPLFVDGEPSVGPMAGARSLATLDQTLRVVMKARNRIHDLTFNPNTVRGALSLQPWQLFELTGLCVQLQSLWQMYGPEEVQFFADSVVADRQSPYAFVLRLVQRLSEKVGTEVNWGIASLVATWCLFGSYERDQWSACPSMRFVKVWDLISREGIDLDEDIETLYDHWSAQLGVSTVREAVEESRKVYARIPAMLERQISGIEGSYVSKAHAEFLIRVTTAVARSSAAMADAFLDDMASYVSPYAYLRTVKRYVNPLLRVLLRSTGAVLDAPLEELERRGFLIEWAVEEEGKNVALSYLEPYRLSTIQFVEPADAVQLSELFAITEFVFSDLGHERAEVQRAGRVFFQNGEIVPIQVF
jgi:hypothetical protein